MRIVFRRARAWPKGRGLAERWLLPMGVVLGGWFLVAGCASPGRPLPPSLRLPAPVTDLRAERVGEAVELRWTTPSVATDGVALKGAVPAEVCREVVVPGGLATGFAAAACTVVQRTVVARGATSVKDALPAGVTAEPAGALVYRVRLLNAAGHDAGLSNAVFAASGQAPAMVVGLRASSAVQGVRLQWAAAAGPAAAMEMRRTNLSLAGGEVTSKAGVGPGPAAETGELKRGRRAGGRGAAAPLGGGQPAADRGGKELLVDAGAADAGGAIDATAMRDREYQYVLTRVRTVRVAGQSLTLRGPASAAVAVAVKDLAAPGVPQELAAAVDGLEVSLSWQPEFAADLAGYRVYREELATKAAAGTAEHGPLGPPWQRLNERLLATPGFRDVVPHEGQFRYRVTAVDGSGNESAAGNAVEVRATAGAGQ